MEERNKSQETLSEVMDNIGDLFEKFVTEWNKLVKLEKENLAWLEKVKRGEV